MTRTGVSEPIQIKPASNVFTALAAIGLVAAVVTLVALWMSASSQFPNGLL